MMLRSILALSLLCLVHGDTAAQYWIILERGDTIAVKEYYTKGDSLGFPGGRVAKRDVLCMTSGKHIYQFPLPGLDLSTTKLDETEPVCRRAALFALKYVGAEPGTPVVDPLVDSLSLGPWKTCFGMHCPYRDPEGTSNSGTTVVVALDLSVVDMVASEVDVTASPPLVIMRNGDTLTAPRGVNWLKGDLLLGGGASVPIDSVLMIVEPAGQHVMHARTGQKVKLNPQVRDLSPCAKGVIYAKIYWDSVSFPFEIEGLPNSLGDDPMFSDCFYYQQKRAQKKKDTMRTISTVIAIGKGAGAR
jgi:hypothetical protein